MSGINLFGGWSNEQTHDGNDNANNARIIKHIPNPENAILNCVEEPNAWRSVSHRSNADTQIYYKYKINPSHSGQIGENAKDRFKIVLWVGEAPMFCCGRFWPDTVVRQMLGLPMDSNKLLQRLELGMDSAARKEGSRHAMPFGWRR